MLGNAVLLAGSFAVSCLGGEEALAALNATFATRGVKQIQLPSDNANLRQQASHFQTA
jgi:hypothetical protein